MLRKTLALAIILALVGGGCSGMSYTEQRVLSGGAIGAASGAAIGAAAGSAATGAAIGGGAGLLGGYLYDSYEKYHGRP
jgi:osmotically inducible lipoprotein OsmB